MERESRNDTAPISVKIPIGLPCPPKNRSLTALDQMTIHIFPSWGIALAALFAAARPAFAAGPPATPQRPVTDVYHGVTVVDNYRWLENSADPEVRQWSAAQNAATRAYLDNLPARSNIVKRLQKIYSQTAASYSDLQARPGLLFAMKFQPPAQQPWLITLKSPDDRASTMGSTSRSNSGSISRGGPGRRTRIFPSRSTIWPGAVPFSFISSRPPSMRSACFSLTLGMGRLKRLNRSFSHST